MAAVHGIHNVFDDNGYKDLLLLTLFGLRKLGREGDDAVDAQGRQFETKTVARVSSKGMRKTSLSVTTEHTMNLANIERYRQTFMWIVAIFDGAEPEAVWEIRAASLEPFFALWESRLRELDDYERPALSHDLGNCASYAEATRRSRAAARARACLHGGSARQPRRPISPIHHLCAPT